MLGNRILVIGLLAASFAERQALRQLEDDGAELVYIDNPEDVEAVRGSMRQSVTEIPLIPLIPFKYVPSAKYDVTVLDRHNHAKPSKQERRGQERHIRTKFRK